VPEVLDDWLTLGAVTGSAGPGQDTLPCSTDRASFGVEVRHLLAIPARSGWEVANEVPFLLSSWQKFASLLPACHLLTCPVAGYSMPESLPQKRRPMIKQPVLTRLQARDPKSELFRVVVETPKGSRNKYKYDEELGVFILDKVLPLGAVFPFDFGFIPSTRGEDGDPLDVLVSSATTA
jgi:hypothetical protein